MCHDGAHGPPLLAAACRGSKHPSLRRRPARPGGCGPGPRRLGERLPSQTAVQHVLIEDVALADFLGWVLSGVPAINREQRLWRRTGADFRTPWHKALNALQCDDLHWQPAGLRGGGATEHFLRHWDVQGRRRRGRWTQLTTLDRYLQEGVLQLAQRTEEAKRLRHLAHLEAAFFRRKPDPPPPLHATCSRHGGERGSSFN